MNTLDKTGAKNSKFKINESIDNVFLKNTFSCKGKQIFKAKQLVKMANPIHSWNIVTSWESDLSSEIEDALIRISQVHSGVKRHPEVSLNSFYLASDHTCFRSQAVTSQ